MPHKPHDLTRSVQASLDHLVESFSLFPLSGLPVPQPKEWATFVREHDGYLDGSGGFGYQLLETGRSVLPQDVNYQRFAGAILRNLFENDELMLWGGFTEQSK